MKCYEILDIRPGATVEHVRKAYIELTHVWDPAKHVGNPPLMQVTEEKRREIDDAYHALQAFLPDISRGAHIEQARPVRPEDAITDAPFPSAAPETSAILYFVIACLLFAIIAGTAFVCWRFMFQESPITTAIPVD